jgi:prepilin-type N-terminal cleavage/methylation domain-containing protein
MTLARGGREPLTTVDLRRGFTITELMIVMAVIIVLAGVGVPAFGATLARSRIQSNASQMLQDLRLVRDSAIIYQQDLYVYVGTDQDSSPTVYYYELFQKDPANLVEASKHYVPTDAPVPGKFVRKDLSYGMSFGIPVHGSTTTVGGKDYLVLAYCCGKDSHFRGQPVLVGGTLAPPYTVFSGSVGIPSVGIPIVDSSSRTWYVTVSPAGRASSSPVSP